jgi:hypothetical protein
MHNLMREVRDDLLAREKDLEPYSIGAHLVAMRDPKTGARLPLDVLLAEIGIMFFACESSRPLILQFRPTTCVPNPESPSLLVDPH